MCRRVAKYKRSGSGESSLNLGVGTTHCSGKSSIVTIGFNQPFDRFNKEGNKMKVANFKELMSGYESAEIVCPIKNEVVRKLVVDGNTVNIEAGSDTVSVPIHTAVAYEPWTFDRGNLLFWEVAAADDEKLKLCTEGDKIRFPDGTEDSLYPTANSQNDHLAYRHDPTPVKNDLDMLQAGG